MNPCRKIKVEPPDVEETVYVHEKTVEVQTDHSHPLNCQVWCPACCTSDVAIPDYSDIETPIMKTVASQTDHTHSEGWIVQCSICSSSVVPSTPPDWSIKLESQPENERAQCNGSKRFLTTGSDTRVQDVSVETSPSYAKTRERPFDYSVYRMERGRFPDVRLGPERAVTSKFSPPFSMAHNNQMSHNGDVSRNFVVPSNVVTSHTGSIARGVPVSRIENMSRGLNISANGDIPHDVESCNNFNAPEEAEFAGRVVLPPNVVEVNSLGYTVERRPEHNRATPPSDVVKHAMENSSLGACHENISHDSIDPIQNGVEEDRALKKAKRGPRRGARQKTKAVKATKVTNAGEVQKRNWKNVYQCPYCDMSFGWLSHITRHVRSHTGEKPFKCSHCSKRFARTDELQLHLRVHTGERPYECQYCGKKFTQSANLTVHIRIHTGKKPYKCDICKKRFVHSGDYRRHLRVHTREKPYECCYCFKAFADSSDLKVHIRIHTGEMPYQCPLCFKRFRTSGNLNVHVRGGSCQKMKESVKDKKLDLVKKVPSPLPMMASDIPMIAEPSAPAEPGEDFRKLQGTQEIE